jgi:hypothetical protein
MREPKPVQRHLGRQVLTVAAVLAVCGGLGYVAWKLWTRDGGGDQAGGQTGGGQAGGEGKNLGALAAISKNIALLQQKVFGK